MQIVVITNPHDSRQQAAKDTLKNQLDNLAQSVEVRDFNETYRDLFHISAFPAIIIAPETLQGERLMEAGEDGELFAVKRIREQYEMEQAALNPSREPATTAEDNG